MIRFMEKPWHWLLAGLWLLGSATSQADANPSLLDMAEECANREVLLERLACYDALFRHGDGLPAAPGLLPPLWHVIHAQEKDRPEGDMAPRMWQRGEDVLISVPAMGTTFRGPLLVIACENEITHFQIHLPRPAEVSRARVVLSGEGAELRQVWRIRHYGHVATGGRGLPAIETLRQLRDINDLVVSSDLSELDGLRFELTGFRELLAPLRARCRW